MFCGAAVGINPFGEVDGVEHRLVARNRQLAGNSHISQDIVVLAVVSCYVDKHPVGVAGFDRGRSSPVLGRVIGSPVSSSTLISPKLSSCRNLRR